MILGVIFDLDMCIFDTRSLGERILDPLIVPLSQSGLSAEIQRDVALALWTSSLEDIVKIYEIPAETADEMRNAYKNLEAPDGIKTFGDEDYIKDLKVVKVLVTTGLQKFQISKILKLGIGTLFSEIIIDTTDNPAKRKGKTAIFRELLTRYGWKPSEVLVIGDNPLSELRSAKDLGIISVQTLRPTVANSDIASHHIESLSELQGIIDFYE